MRAGRGAHCHHHAVDVVVVGLLVLGVVVLTPLADRVGIPQPVLLTLYGLALGALPFLPAPALPPELILPLVLPPLLFAATQTTSVPELRSAARPILVFAVGLTLTSAALVAVVSHAAGLPWAAAAVLGAVVAPPDPVAASAVASRLNLPARLVTILEGEGQFNDATALVAYQLAVMAAVTGVVTLSQVGTALVVAVLGGTALGLAGGLVGRWALAVIHDAAVETTITLALPFLLYLAAEELGASGVLAVLVAGLSLRSRAAARATTAGGFVLGRAVWRYVEFIITGLLFAFLGIELTEVLRSSDVAGNAGTWTLAALVVGTLVAARFAVVFGATAVGGRSARRREQDVPATWREAGVTSWAGMRGVVTVATALALPEGAVGGAFPAREEIVVVALVVVLATLVVQGLTLAPLISRLGVAGSDDPAVAARDLAARAAQAALDRIVRPGRGSTGADGEDVDDAPEELRAMVVDQYRARLGVGARAVAAIEADEGDTTEGHLRRLVFQATEAEREVVLAARASGEVSPGVADAALLDIESRALRQGG